MFLQLSKALASSHGVFKARPINREVVRVVNEQREPLKGVGVIFYQRHARIISKRPTVNHWAGSPPLLRGVYLETNEQGEVYLEPHEAIFVWHLEDGNLKYSSDIVKGGSEFCLRLS